MNFPPAGAPDSGQRTQRGVSMTPQAQVSYRGAPYTRQSPRSHASAGRSGQRSTTSGYPSYDSVPPHRSSPLSPKHRRHHQSHSINSLHFDPTTTPMVSRNANGLHGTHELSATNPAYPMSPDSPSRRGDDSWHSSPSSAHRAVHNSWNSSYLSVPTTYMPGAALQAAQSDRYRPIYSPSKISSAPGSNVTSPAGAPPNYPLWPSAEEPGPPHIRRVQSRSDLGPAPTPPPKYRRALPEGGYLSPLRALSTSLASTYHLCDPTFTYNSSRNPRRVLTEPREAKLNGGYDNEESDYILWVNDVLGADENRRYLVLNVLGKGTFGQVVKCQNMATKEVVAVKVIKNKPAYLNQSMMEVSILEHVQNHVDKHDRHNLLRLKDRFVHKEHLCLVFDLLSSNLYEVVRKNQFRGLNIQLVRTFTKQLLESLAVLKEARLIHCDLKPENILLKRNDSTSIKIIDFGSACHERQSVYTYIQSRFYRSPEVILGLPYTSSIDMWSLGCIVAELFLGLPIFPGTSEYNQWCRIVTSLGEPPNWMLEMGKNTANFMKKSVDDQGNTHYRLRTLEEQVAEFKTEEKPMKQYFNSTDIREIIMSYPLLRNDISKSDIKVEMQQREALADFVKGLLTFNPFERWTPQQASMHPFITGRQYNGPYIPENLNPRSLTPPQSRAQMQPSQMAPPAQPFPAPQNVQPYARQSGRAAYEQTIAQQSAHAQALQPPMPQVYAEAEPLAPPFMAMPAEASGGLLGQYVPQTQAVNAPNVSVSMGAQDMYQRMYVPNGGSAFMSPSSHAGVPYQYQRYPNQVPVAGGGRSRRLRAATIGQPDPVPGPLQRAAARMNPAVYIPSQPCPAYVPPPEIYRQQKQA